MSFLNRKAPEPSGDDRERANLVGNSTLDRIVRPGLFAHCANPDCRSGWIHLFRNRSTPQIEAGWTCSPQCTQALVDSIVRKEFESGRSARPGHRHRIPLGLLMLENGWITPEQLRKALDAQKQAKSGRIGEWLVKQRATDESVVTRALALQWSCAMMSVEPGAPRALVSVMPRLFLDAFGVLPLRVTAGNVLYLGFEQDLDPVLALAVEEMTGLRVESVIVPSSEFRSAQAITLRESFPHLQLGEALTPSVAAHMLARAIERTQPVATRMVRVHDSIWLRMHLVLGSGIRRMEDIRDVVCSVGSN